MTGSSMLEYARILHRDLVQKGLLDKEGAAQKVVLFLDSYPAHLEIEFSKFCEEHGIILICLLENANHILQPIEAVMSAILKQHCDKEFQDHKLSCGESVNKLNIGSKLDAALKKISSTIIQYAFR